MNKNILVLGSEGQIGKPLSSFLSKNGYSVRGWDKKNSIAEDLSVAKNLPSLKADCEWADKVIFLAFEVGGSKYLAATDKTFNYIQENVQIMSHTFEALRDTKKPFLFSSSQMSNMHHTNYGFLKDLGERYARTMDNSWICRFWNVYGVEDCEESKRHVITDFINAAKHDHKISMRTKGIEERQFLHVDDCTRAIFSWVKDDWDDPSQYYDITSFEWSSIRDIAEIISGIIGNVEVVAGTADDQLQKMIKNPPDSYIRKFWKPILSIEEGICKIINEESKQ